MSTYTSVLNNDS